MKPPPPAESMQTRMQQLRCDIGGDMEEVAASARSLLDWKHCVKNHPWVCLGSAAALGFLLFRKQSAAIRPDLGTLVELARSGHLVVTPAPTATRGLVDALVAGVANMAIRKATAYLGQSAGRLLGTTGQPQTGRQDSIGAP